MKILMVNIPFAGHVNPTLALAKELTRRGHEVTYILTNEWKAQIEKNGAHFVPYKDHESFKIEFKNGHPKHFFKAIKAWKYSYDTILSLSESYDILLYEFFTFIGAAAAKEKCLTPVRQYSTFAVNRNNITCMMTSKNVEIKLLNNRFFLKMITRIICSNIPLYTEHILSEITDVPVMYNLVYTSREFQRDSSSFPKENYYFAGPAIMNRFSDIAIPFERMKATKIIYISLGTLQNNHLKLYKKCIEAFIDRPEFSIIMSVGSSIPIKDLGELPPHIYAYPYVPQLEVLKHSSIFITHGGMNSVNEGLYFENKCIVIPMDVDQFAIGKRVQELHIGYCIDRKKFTTQELNCLINQILRDELMTCQVKRISQSLKASGGVHGAADYIESVLK